MTKQSLSRSKLFPGNSIEILCKLIREQSHTQLILTTHSPYALDIFEPEEVSLCLMEEDGSISVHRLSESEVVQKERGIFSLGEIWTSVPEDKALIKANPRESEC